MQANQSNASNGQTAYNFEVSADRYDQSDYDYHNLPNKGSFGSDGNSHTGFIDHYIEKFNQFARGRVANKYHVVFYGPYVEQALLIMAKNASADKYQPTARKKFAGEEATYSKFAAWANMFFDKKSSSLNMYWSATQVEIGAATAEVEDLYIDSMKGMSIPVVKGVKTGSNNSVSITVVDDPYMMWYQFFNALFNTQFTPLVMKATDTFHKINIRVNEYMEMSTDNDAYTDAHIGQMFEFNTCVLKSAPKVSMQYGDAKQVTYTVEFAHPNAFQGSFKERLRYMHDFTSCTDDTGITTPNDSSTTPLDGQMWNAYGDYNLGHFYIDTKIKSPDKFAALRMSDWPNDTSSDTKVVIPTALQEIAKKDHASTTVGWNGERWHQVKG